MKKESYHLFKVRGDSFVYCPSSGLFFSISPLAFEALSILKSSNNQNILHQLIEKGYDTEDIKSFNQELSLLAENGLFGQKKNIVNVKERIRIIEREDYSHGISDLQLMLSEGCNLACLYCYCPTHLKDNRLMSSTIAKAAVDLLTSNGAKKREITFFGGEPLLNKPVIDYVISYSKTVPSNQNPIHYVITTNATLLDDTMINHIVYENFGLLVSLDGPRELHDSQCPDKTGKGSYRIASKNIKKLMRQRTVSVRATMCHPIPRIKGLISFFRRFGFSKIILGYATNQAEHPNSMSLSSLELQDAAYQIEEELNSILWYMKRGRRPPYFPHERWVKQIMNTSSIIIPTNSCAAGTSTFGVDSDGYLYPCAKFCGMKEWITGNVFTGPNWDKCKSIWKEYQSLLHKHCGTCWAYPFCNGPCIWECAREDGTMCFSDKFCFLVQRQIEQAAWLAYKCRNSSTTTPEHK